MACGKSEAKERLLRFVWSSGEAKKGPGTQSSSGALVVDIESRLPGRGAYCHPALDCLRGKRTAATLCRSLQQTGGEKVELKEVIKDCAEQLRKSGVTRRSARSEKVFKWLADAQEAFAGNMRRKHASQFRIKL